MRKLFVMLLVIITVGCSSKAPIVDRANYYINKSFSFISQDDLVKFLIFHYTTVINDSRSLQILTQAKVSAHYLITEIPKIKNSKPIIFNLVPENKIAWNAGLSNWNGRLNLNDSSVGIEIVNKEFTEDMLVDKIWFILMNNKFLLSLF